MTEHFETFRAGDQLIRYDLIFLKKPTILSEEHVMDIIVSAITGALANLGVQAVGDAYEGVKAVLTRKFGADSDLADAVKKLEQKPDAQGRQITLKEEAEAAGADKDAEIMKAVEALLAAVKAQPGGEEAVRVINQQVTGNENIFSGTGNVTVTR
jgi:hypothetical protein